MFSQVTYPRTNRDAVIIWV